MPSARGAAVPATHPTGERRAPTRTATADGLVARARDLRLAGDLDGARTAYREAGALHGPTAESAWLALARLERDAGRSRAAIEAIDERARRFGAGSLGAESAGLGFRLARDLGDAAVTRRFAEQIVAEHATSPQAPAARAWLASAP
jgi:Tfp pilus assembly protein PilF